MYKFVPHTRARGTNSGLEGAKFQGKCEHEAGLEPTLVCDWSSGSQFSYEMECEYKPTTRWNPKTKRVEKSTYCSYIQKKCSICGKKIQENETQDTCQAIFRIYKN